MNRRDFLRAALSVAAAAAVIPKLRAEELRKGELGSYQGFSFRETAGRRAGKEQLTLEHIKRLRARLDMIEQPEYVYMVPRGLYERGAVTGAFAGLRVQTSSDPRFVVLV